MTDDGPTDSGYPDFIVGVGFFSWDCDHLKSLQKTIHDWQKIAEGDVAGLHRKLSAQHSSEDAKEYLADWNSNEEFRVHETARIMYAGLAVAIASHVEACFGFFCEKCGITLADGASWGEKRRQLERKVVSDGCLSIVNGHSDVQRSRILGNCFKHNGGKANDEFTKGWGGTAGDLIEYECQPWQTIICGVETFLHEVFKMSRQYWT